MQHEGAQLSSHTLGLMFMCSVIYKKGNNDTAQAALLNNLLYCRYYRLPLPMEGAPMEEDFDAFVNILRVSSYNNVNRGN